MAVLRGKLATVHANVLLATRIVLAPLALAVDRLARTVAGELVPERKLMELVPPPVAERKPERQLLMVH